MNIVYIHGNNATATSFDFIRSCIVDHSEILVKYNSSTGFYSNHKNMLRHLDGEKDIFFVAHSLGGIHALHLAHHLGDRVIGGVTLSTPYGGSSVADAMACFMPFCPVMNDIRSTSRPIVEARRIKPPRVWTNIVTTAGATPFMFEPNDGVVAIQSMRDRRDIRLVDVHCNHFDVVSSKRTVDVLLHSINEALSADADELVCTQ